jgi:sugar lactone lactonase YvrE
MPTAGARRGALRYGLYGAGLLLLALAAYLGLAPVPIEPVVWKAPPDPGYQGPHARNERLAGLTLIPLDDDSGPEHLAFGPDGKLYAATASGRILRMDRDGGAREVYARIDGGRVLGFDFDAQGRIIAADAYNGLIAIEPGGRIVSTLANRVGADDPILYADAVVVARSGKIYFTDASRRFGPKQWGGTFNASVLDILEHSSTGRVLEFDPATRTLRTLLSGLCFANGLALSADERHLFVAETGEYRVWKLAVDADKLDAATVLAHAATRDAVAAKARVLLDNLPGYPDNLMRGQGGKIWLGLAKPRGKAVDDMADKPWLRALTLRLPRALWPVPPAYGHVLAFDESGRVVADLQDPSGRYPETTGVTEAGDRLYIHSLHATAIGYLPKR